MESRKEALESPWIPGRIENGIFEEFREYTGRILECTHERMSLRNLGRNSIRISLRNSWKNTKRSSSRDSGRIYWIKSVRMILFFYWINPEFLKKTLSWHSVGINMKIFLYIFCVECLRNTGNLASLTSTLSPEAVFRSVMVESELVSQGFQTSFFSAFIKNSSEDTSENSSRMHSF